jgi:hypothetical protein
MNESWTLQGRSITSADIDFVRRLIEDNPSFSRRRLSIELCRLWNWTDAAGRLKDMASRTLLLKLEQKQLLILPPRRQDPRPAALRPYVPHPKDAIDSALKTLRPIEIVPVEPASLHWNLFACLVNEYHYLGYKTSVGESMKYLVFDRRGRTLACLLFGSAAWKTAPRDVFIGWSHDARQKNVNLITNNTRFLVLPWVKVPHLASHVLSLASKRIMGDWIKKYNHPVWALETFVDCERFKGTCYKAANWICLGKTKGRTRSDRFHKIQVPIKDVYLYPMAPDFREALRRGT